MSKFVHLRLHTEYSITEGLVRIPHLIDECIKMEMPAVSITDLNNMFGAIRFYKRAESFGIKPIIGVELSISGSDDSLGVFRVVVLSKNLTGYKNILKLVSSLYVGEQLDENERSITFGNLVRHKDGLIVLSGGRFGNIGKAILKGNLVYAKTLMRLWEEAFGNNFYVELHRAHPEDDAYLHKAVSLADELSLPIVATNPIQYLNADDHEAHLLRCSIADRVDLSRFPTDRYSDQQYFKSSEEMCSLFSDLPDALANSLEIAKRCTTTLSLGTPTLPNFDIPSGQTVDEYFQEMAWAGLKERMKENADSIDFSKLQQEYEDRLNFELNIITQMGFPGYYLIVADFIGWSRRNGIPVGPGRGSGTGSLVAYTLRITDMDPIEYDLIFERFLNPERVSMPDFDVDFCIDGRDKVIDYVKSKYGSSSVSQISTFGRMAAKAVVRDVARVLGFPYGVGDRLSKAIPYDVGIKLKDCMAEGQDLRLLCNEDEDNLQIVDMALKLEGVTRSVGKHAGGVVIAPTEILEFSPLYSDGDAGSIVTQYDKDDVEDAGLVKFDFLGLRTLTIIKNTLLNIGVLSKQCNTNSFISTVDDIPLDDGDTFEMLRQGKTVAVFQLESAGMTELVVKLQPEKFRDLIPLVALFRPGPLQTGMVDDFINVRHGRAAAAYPHKDLESVLSPTFGVILYQEQVMQIARDLSSYSLGEADLLRRAMGKKKPAIMQQQKSMFVERAVDNGYDRSLASEVFDLMAKFSGYGFPKAHSATYALIAYHTAWLKVHHTAAFLASVLSADMEHVNKLYTTYKECNRSGISIVAPDVNSSTWHFTVTDDKTILMGLGSIKGVGEAFVEAIVAERSKGGAFQTFDDFIRRVCSNKVSKAMIQRLVEAGCFAFTGVNRRELIDGIDSSLREAKQRMDQKLASQEALFGWEEKQQVQTERPHSSFRKTDQLFFLAKELELMGVYVTGHPADYYSDLIKSLGATEIGFINASISASMRPSDKICAIVTVASLDVKRTRVGKELLVLELSDASGNVEAVMFDPKETDKAILSRGAIAFVFGNVKERNKVASFTIDGAMTIDECLKTHANSLTIAVRANEENAGEKNMVSLKGFLEGAVRGDTKVSIDYSNDHARCTIQLKANSSVAITESSLETLEQDLEGRYRVSFNKWHLKERPVQIKLADTT